MNTELDRVETVNHSDVACLTRTWHRPTRLHQKPSTHSRYFTISALTSELYLHASLLNRDTHLLPHSASLAVLLLLFCARVPSHSDLRNAQNSVMPWWSSPHLSCEDSFSRIIHSVWSGRPSAVMAIRHRGQILTIDSTSPLFIIFIYLFCSFSCRRDIRSTFLLLCSCTAPFFLFFISKRL